MANVLQIVVGHCLKQKHQLISFVTREKRSVVWPAVGISHVRRGQSGLSTTSHAAKKLTYTTSRSVMKYRHIWKGCLMHARRTKLLHLLGLEQLLEVCQQIRLSRMMNLNPPKKRRKTKSGSATDSHIGEKVNHDAISVALGGLVICSCGLRGEMKRLGSSVSM